MSQFDAYLESYSNDQFKEGSSRHGGQHQNSIPEIKRENFDDFLSGSADIKRQLSQSFSGSGAGGTGGGSGNIGSGGITGSGNNAVHHGGISKPHSRRNSAYIRSQEGSDAEDNNDNDDEENQGNERKRRDNINDKIQELLTLIPSEFFEIKDEPKVKTESSPSERSPNEDDVNNTVSKTGTKDGKPNKGQILTKAVEYLQSLQNLIDENNRKEVELIMKLETLKLKQKNHGIVNDSVPIRIGYTSAERALGEIGVGPCSEDYFKNILVKSANASKSSRKNYNG
ncbi:RTG1 [Candida margitis]|uniref:RTG1 n=1 Tax=Candida margitis TaxID=1775924 RepID=UPI0022264CBF|nr:RTG1 [Candida margitis]KAI5968735.1 RTG1 [Candida margitis]